MTRSIPIVKARNQSVAYGAYNYTQTGRTILTFFDQLTLNFEEQCYNRNFYIRYSYQEKLDGRNFAFTAAPYTIELDLKMNNRNDWVCLYTSGTGSNEYFTIYPNYEFLNPGQQIQKINTTEDYFSIDEFIYITETYLGETYLKHIYLTFYGSIQEGSEGSFIYGSPSSEIIPFNPKEY